MVERSPLAAVTITSSVAAGDGHEQTLILNLKQNIIMKLHIPLFLISFIFASAGILKGLITIGNFLFYERKTGVSMLGLISSLSLISTAACMLILCYDSLSFIDPDESNRTSREIAIKAVQRQWKVIFIFFAVPIISYLFERNSSEFIKFVDLLG
jgi:hypothetical protein